MSFNDDEEIVLNDNAAGNNADVFDLDKISLKFQNADEAPLEKFDLRVMLELTAVGDVSHRPGLDLVTVLDISSSMKGRKIKEMKRAMQFLLKKLSPIDRLSVITFSNNACRLCPLTQMTEDSETDLMDLIDNIVAGGETNITEGLQTAIKVLNDRRFTERRSIGIMLMSDGEQNRGGDAAEVEVSDVPVYTFGFGTGGKDPKAMADVLNAIAENSQGGTFSNVEKVKDLNMAFAKCLGGLLTVAVQGFILNIAPVKGYTTIDNVSAGDYETTELDDGTVNITFGVLYQKETRRVMVDLVLSEVPKRVSRTVVSVQGKASNDLELDKLESKEFGNISSARVIRTPNFKGLVEKDEVIIEESRLETAEMMKEARIMADNNDLNGAKNKIIDAQSMLDDVDLQGTVKMLEMLKQELDQFMAYLQSPELYKKHGRAFALSSELSHARQRFAARGDMDKLSLFSTPRMDAYQQQAKSFDKDPTKPVPTVEEDQKQDIIADPLSPIIAPLTRFLQQAIEALQSIAFILNSASPQG